MHAAFELGAQGLVDHAMAFETALSAERLRHDVNAEMGLPAGLGAGMAGVQGGLINDFDAFGREGFGQLFRDDISDGHWLCFCLRNRRCSKASHARPSMLNFDPETVHSDLSRLAAMPAASA